MSPCLEKKEERKCELRAEQFPTEYPVPVRRFKQVKERGELCLRVWTQGIGGRINESGKTEVAGWLEQAQTALEDDVVMDLTPGD